MGAMPSESESSSRVQQLALVIDRLACPACLGALTFDDSGLRCSGCARFYAIVDGIPQFVSPSEQK